jgi:hypothetical protein
MRALMCTAIGCLLLALSASLATKADAQPRWDKLDNLLRTARESGTEILAPDVLDLSLLDPRDALLIVAPDDALPTGALTSFLREGGRIALLDDFGPAERLLAAYQVTRLPAPTGEVPALRSNRSLLIAYPASEHPLVEGVDLLLTNGASALHHRELKPVFTFGHTDSALVLAGAVGAGRLVALGDASLLINQLMALPSHQRFAKNLLTYLKRPGGRVLLIDAHTRVEGSYGGGNTRGISQVDAFLKRIAHPDLPAGMLSLLGLGLCAIAVVIVVGGLPRRSPYVRSELLPRTSVYAGFAARVALSERDPPNLIWTLLDYRRELTAELLRRLELSAPATPATILDKARAAGLPAAAIGTLEGLLARLDLLAARAEAPDKLPRIRVSELRNVVRQGEELLTRLGNG